MPQCYYTVLLEWDETAFAWVAYVPALDWLSDYGTTEDEAKRNITRAIVAWVETAAAAGLPVPTQDPPGELIPPWETAPNCTATSAHPRQHIRFSVAPA